MCFLDKEFKFQPDVCNGCHDASTMSINLNNVAILNNGGAEYRCITSRIRNSDEVTLLQNVNLTAKIGEFFFKIKISIITSEMGKEIIRFGNTEVEKHKFYKHKNSATF